MENMDLAIIVGLVVFAFFGWKSGLIKKVVALAALLLGIVLGAKYSSSVGEGLLSIFTMTQTVATVLGFFLVVVSVMILQSILYKVLVSRMIEGIWNRIGGILAGLFEGALVASIVLIVLNSTFEIPSTKVKVHSVLYKPVKNFAPLIFDKVNTIFPESRDFYEELLLKSGL
jgi:membrane protein required for colicin V production